jgi:membrane protease YdiL (CAAX protease family)
MHYASLIIELSLVGYIVWESMRALPRYRQLKQAIANGDAEARIRMYREVLAFEGISAVLAIGALGFDWSKLNPKYLALADTQLMRLLSGNRELVRAELIGMAIGLATGTGAWIVARLLRNRRGAEPAPTTSSSWRKFLPDFAALLPTTTRERLVWVAVAISAGICEEVVFRGWLLAALHGQLGMQGAWLIGTAAVIFGLAHAYQQITGVVATGLFGVLACLLYIGTGSLLAPIILHVIVDLRAALVPSLRAHQEAPGSPSLPTG